MRLRQSILHSTGGYELLTLATHAAMLQQRQMDMQHASTVVRGRLVLYLWQVLDGYLEPAAEVALQSLSWPAIGCTWTAEGGPPKNMLRGLYLPETAMHSVNKPSTV